MGFGGIISPLPANTFFLKGFPAFLNFSPDVYFLAYYGDIKLRNDHGNVLLLRNVNTSTEAEEQEDLPKGILSRIFHPFLRFFPKSKNE